MQQKDRCFPTFGPVSHNSHFTSEKSTKKSGQPVSERFLSGRGVKESRLGGNFLKVGDQVLSVTLLLQTGEDHLGARNVFLGVFQVVEEVFRSPGDAGGLVGLGVRETFAGAGFTAEETAEVGTCVVVVDLH